MSNTTKKQPMSVVRHLFRLKDSSSAYWTGWGANAAYKRLCGQDGADDILKPR